MKLFRQLLVAPAALGLFLPLSANASEVNIKGITSYTDLDQQEEEYNFSHNDFSGKKPLLISGGEGLGLTQDYDSDSFSSTTSMDGTASFLLSAGSGDETTMGDTEALNAIYYYGINLNTSFTGEDNLAVTIETGNTPTGLSAATAPTALDFGAGLGSSLTLVDINYTRSIGDKLTFTVGDSLDVSANFTGACAYSGFTDQLSDCGTGQTAGAGGDVTVSSVYEIGNGFSFGAGISGLEGSSTDGLFTKEGADLYALQLAYSADNYGLAVSYASADVPTGDGGAFFGGLTSDTTFWGVYDKK